eukprot:c10225_g1_i1 orf=164-2155(-)
MGSCFSKRKRSDAAVIHNASPRSSFSLSCKGDVVTAPSPLRPHKPSDEIVVVLSKDSAPLLANTQSSLSSKKLKSKKVLSGQQVENSKPVMEEKCSVSHSKSQSNSDTFSSVCEDNKALPISNSHEASTDKALQCSHSREASMHASKPPNGADAVEHVATVRHVTPVYELVDDDANGSNAEDKEVLFSIDDEFVIEVDEVGTVVPSLAKLKRSRSCEEAVQAAETVRPLRRRSFQESSTFSPSTSKLETIPEPHFGTTKYLEGLDLVDVLPYKSSQNEAQNGGLCGVEGELRPNALDLSHLLSQHESNGLSADFFVLKKHYLSLCSAALQDASPSNLRLQGDDGLMSPHDASQGMISSHDASLEADDGMMKGFGRMHSRASSLDSVEHMEMVSLFPSCRHPISAVKEEDEDECPSDDSETFEFKHAVSIYAHTQNQKKAQLRSRVAEEGREGEIKGDSFCRFNEGKELCRAKEGNGMGRFKELSVVSTGDAVLYTGSNSEEFDLIPSKSYVRGSPKKESNSSSAMVASNQSTYYNSQKGLDDDEEKQQQGSLSVEDIIFLLERDELDEEVLLSFLNFARSTTTSHGGNTPSCQASEVASEASFEFKVKSSGSTPHSTPSTPMLSAGSTPKRITQLSPLALTPEEIAEIWGVFEQRQGLSPFQM